VLRVLGDLPLGAKVLDLGSPKDLAIFLARRLGYQVTSTDILRSEVDISRRSAEAQSAEGTGPGRVRAEIQDGRALTFADATFDAAFSVSVLEHIPENGDSEAVRELVRVIRPGGQVVLTVPYALSHHDVYVNTSVYERKQVSSEPLFFERHYDALTLMSRLCSQSGAEVAHIEIWGEGRVRVERLLGRIGRFRDLVSPLEAVLAKLSLRELSSGSWGHPMAAFLLLTKPGGNDGSAAR